MRILCYWLRIISNKRSDLNRNFKMNKILKKNCFQVVIVNLHKKNMNSLILKSLIKTKTWKEKENYREISAKLIIEIFKTGKLNKYIILSKKMSDEIKKNI